MVDSGRSTDRRHYRICNGIDQKTKLKSVKSQVTAGAYEKAGSLDLTVRTDYFLNRVVTTRKIERKQESGGSSVHTGSSGKSHGGRSGKF